MNGLSGTENLSNVSLFYLLGPGLLLVVAFAGIPVAPDAVMPLNTVTLVWCVIAGISIWKCALNISIKVVGYAVRCIPFVLAPVFLGSLACFLITAMAFHTFGPP